MYVLKNGLPHNRFAVSVNAKIGNSVRRNYIKRRMKEMFRLHQDKVNGGYDLWVSIKRPFDRFTAAPVESVFAEALARIGDRP